MPNKTNKDKKSEETKTPLIETEEIVIEETEENIEKVSLENIEEKAEGKPEKPKDIEEKAHDIPPGSAKSAEEEPKNKDVKNEFFSLDDKPSSHKKNKKIFAMGIIVTAFILFATGILLFLILGSGVKEEKAVKEETITEEATPTPEKLNKEDWSFEVLNGSGISGLAAKKAKALEDAGYTVVKKGNADNQKYEITELYVTEEMESKAKLLIEDLKAEFKVTEVKGKLTTDSTASARIILGKDQE